jgi:hypothetical protein
MLISGAGAGSEIFDQLEPETEPYKNRTLRFLV